MKIKNCPFCGGKAYAAAIGAEVYCQSCRAIGPNARNRVEAIERWNKRDGIAKWVRALAACRRIAKSYATDEPIPRSGPALVVYELDRDGEAQSVHFFCSPECREAEGWTEEIPHFKFGESADYVVGTVCEFCEVPLKVD